MPRLKHGQKTSATQRSPDLNSLLRRLCALSVGRGRSRRCPHTVDRKRLRVDKTVLLSEGSRSLIARDAVEGPAVCSQQRDAFQLGNSCFPAPMASVAHQRHPNTCRSSTRPRHAEINKIPRRHRHVPRCGTRRSRRHRAGQRRVRHASRRPLPQRYSNRARLMRKHIKLRRRTARRHPRQHGLHFGQRRIRVVHRIKGRGK